MILEICAEVLAGPRVVEINELRTRNAGRYKFVELDVTLRVGDLERGHRISEELENRLKREIAQVDRILFQRDHRRATIAGTGKPPPSRAPLTIDKHLKKEDDMPEFGIPFFRIGKGQEAQP